MLYKVGVEMPLNLVLYPLNKDIKEYMYGKIKNKMQDKDQRIILIVPEQYTLQAERETLDALNLSGMMDIEVFSFTRLMHTILEQLGGVTKVPIQEHGKHMILFKILNEMDGELEIYKKMAKRHGFIGLLNNLIKDLKQANIGWSDFALENFTQDHIVLKKKMKDIRLIYEKFNTYLEKKYVDTEDLMKIAISKIKQSNLFNNTIFWIDGFDYFNPQMFSILEQIIEYSQEVNINLALDSDKKSQSREVFYVTQNTLDRCIQIAERLSKKYNIVYLDEKYNLNKIKELEHLEQQLFQYPVTPYGEEVQNIQVYGCSNYASEVETVATKIIELVKNKQYRFRDIAIICNDMDNYHHVIKRLFGEYEIPFFMDDKQSIMRNPFIEGIMALLDILSKGYQTEDIFRFLKTGQFICERDAYENLENYAIRYNIRGKKWTKDFVLGRNEYEEKAFEQLNATRKEIISLIRSLDQKINKVSTVSEKTKALYGFLKNECDILNRVEIFIDYLRDNNDYINMRQTAQIWNLILSNFDQMVELIGDIEVSNKEYGEVLKAGFESVEISTIPTTVDEVVIGDVRRSRIGQIKALFIVGANDGILPKVYNSEGLLLEEEKEVLKEYNLEIGETNTFKIKEEKLLLYKLLCQPKEYLFMSYSVSDTSGKEIKPSIFINSLKTIFEALKVKKDILSDRDYSQLIYTAQSTLKHWIGEIGQGIEGKEIAPEWKNVHNWYIDNKDYTKELQMIYKGFYHEKTFEKLRKEHAGKLYEEKVLSPSRLETFASCPQSYFLKYGMQIEERKKYEVASLEMGSIYHTALMLFFKRIKEKRLFLEDLDYDEISSMIEDIIKEISKDYLEGILKSDKSNLYKMRRITKVVKKTTWILVQHIRKGNFNQSYYEASFGRKGLFPPLEVIFENGERVYIEGRIDRVDILSKEDEIYVKVIDYKTGGKDLDLNEIINGLQLQLILYLNAAMEGIQRQNADKTLKPAGMLYFKIDNPLIESDKINDDEQLIAMIQDEIKKRFKMDGIILRDVEIIKEIDHEFEKQSDMLYARLARDGSLAESDKYWMRNNSKN